MSPPVLCRWTKGPAVAGMVVASDDDGHFWVTDSAPILQAKRGDDAVKTFMRLMQQGWRPDLVLPDGSDRTVEDLDD